MAEVRSSRIWTRQPQKLVQIDWSNSLSRGLVAWWTPFTNPGGIYAPLVGDRNGLGLKTSTARTSEYAESQQYFANFTPTQGVTFAALVKPNIGASDYERLISFKASSRSYALQLHSANKLQVVGTDSVDTNRYTDYTLTTAQATGFHLYSSVSTAGSAVDPAYVDGVKLTGGVVGVAGNGVYQQISPAKLQIARLYSNNQWNYGRHDWIGLGLAWNRALTDAEHAELARDPWQLFAPQRQVSYFSATTGVTATLAATQAADVAALSATVTNRASIAPTQAADTAALAATVTNRASIAASQAADTAALGATVTNRAQLAPQQAADTAAINVIAGSLDVAIAATQAPDAAAIVVQLPSRTGAGASRRGKRRRIVLGDQVYDVLERDLPTLLEAVMLNRKPPATAVVEPAQPAARAQEKSEPTQVEARAPLPSLDEARERYEAMLADVNRAATADVAALLQRVADRVLAELEDDEDAAVTLLLH